MAPRAGGLLSATGLVGLTIARNSPYMSGRRNPCVPAGRRRHCFTSTGAPAVEPARLKRRLGRDSTASLLAGFESPRIGTHAMLHDLVLNAAGFIADDRSTAGETRTKSC